MVPATAPAPDGETLTRGEHARRTINRLCLALLVMALIRATPAVAGLLHLLRRALPGGPGARRVVSPPLEDFDPLIVFSLIWPLGIALVWRLSRRDFLARAATLTFLAIGLESLARVLSGGMSTGKVSGERPGPFLTALLSVATVLAFGAAGLAWRHCRETDGPGRDGNERRGERGNAFGRLTILGASVFVLSVLAAEGWTLYVKVVEAHPAIREWVLRSDQAVRQDSAPESPRTHRERLANVALNQGMRLALVGRFQEARRDYARALAEFEALAQEDRDPRRFRRERALAANNLAWLLANCPEGELRDPTRAVELAGRAVEIVPEDGNSWNTLGAAYLRADNCEAARKALDRSLTLRAGGDGFDWYFLALVDARLGRHQSALAWYDKAVHWTERRAPDDGELFQFRSEAAAVLGLPPPPLGTRPRSQGAPADSLQENPFAERRGPGPKR